MSILVIPGERCISNAMPEIHEYRDFRIVPSVFMDSGLALRRAPE